MYNPKVCAKETYIKLYRTNTVFLGVFPLGADVTEGFAARLTDEGFLASMYSDVLLQVARH